ncbi:Bcr/CflA family drug resistance efflux transporter [Terasakiispira papahanaumokuakeensis]|uniref:Bcr/CflA family efflux transporter n=1 Tax=Terasakiispira papahanaumokuakeensis TaxID=197479 RepID=A0A1E2VED5_9GAMM|nr:multidrug effflux MFS transporter [Terasakiispira papahanaumokuakeensis]ODC05232.1 Bcr/CflA family drug resistance efflux transporter [Terasakiispira papahanaumokuakeensis]
MINASEPPSPSYKALTFVLALTLAIGPLALDLYLPAFPAIAADLNVGTDDIGLSVSFYVFTMALSQLIGGALSDRLGRKPILTGGLILFALASFALTQVSTLNSLLGFRVLQAFGGGWVLVSIPALVRDRTSGKAAARLFSMVGLIMIIAPAMAPTLGSFLLQLGSWHLLFLFLGVYALLIMPLLFRFVLQGNPHRPAEGHDRASLWQQYRSVLSTRLALPFIGWQSCCFTTMMIFITHSSFIYQQHFDQTEEAFALLFGANIVIMMVCNLTSRWLLNWVSSRFLLRCATGLQGMGILALSITVWQEGPVMAFLPCMMITIGAMGAITPNLQASYLEFFPKNSGTAAAIMGAVQFSIAGLLSGLSTMLPQTLSAVIAAMSICVAVAWGFMLLEYRIGGAARRSASH